MVVVSIVGILVVLSLKGFKADPAGSDARKVAALMSTAYRQAVGGGTVRSDVAVTAGTTARARVEITVDATTGFNMVAVWKQQELAPPDSSSNWVFVTAEYMQPDVTIFAVDNQSVLAPTGSVAASATAPSTATPIDKNYFPDGTADAFTVYVEKRDATGTRYRVVGLPLAPAPQVFVDW